MRFSIAKDTPRRKDTGGGGRFAAVGYAAQMNLPLRELFIRNPYIPRTFQGIVYPDYPNLSPNAKGGRIAR